MLLSWKRQQVGRESEAEPQRETGGDSRTRSRVAVSCAHVFQEAWWRTPLLFSLPLVEPHSRTLSAAWDRSLQRAETEPGFWGRQ